MESHGRAASWISWLGVSLAALGIADATWLTITHYTAKVALVCPDTGIINCAKVTASSYSMILGIPVALLGLGFFVTMLLLQLPAAWQTKNSYLIWGRLALAASGILMVFWLVYVELFRLNAICLYCTGSHVLAFLLFVVTAIGTAQLAE